MTTRSFYSLAATLALTGAIFSVGNNVMADEPKPEATATKTDAAPVSTASFVFPAKGTAPKLNEAGYKSLTTTHGSDILVVNFWATWCGPCVAELPNFAAASKLNPESRVRFVGLSLDMANQVDSVLVPFLKKKEIPYANFLLDADDVDTFIGSVSSEWTGGIPATIIYDRNGKKISEHLTEMTEEELTKAIEDAKAKVPASAPVAAESITDHAAPASEADAERTSK